MIDFSAIEAEILALFSRTNEFTSTQTGYIREQVAIPQLPSADVSCQGHEVSADANRHYTIPVIIVIRSRSYDREDNATAFKELVETVCERLELANKGISYDVIRGIKSQLGEEQAGDGSALRVVAITLNLLKG